MEILTSSQYAINIKMQLYIKFDKGTITDDINETEPNHAL